MVVSGGAEKEKPAIMGADLCMQLVSVKCLYLPKTINIFSKVGCPVEYANIGNPFKQRVFPFI
jgi:hypothetical protein